MTVLRTTIFETLPRSWRHPPKSAAINPNTANTSHPARFSQSRKAMTSSNRQINASKTLALSPYS
jgi:hypothetical protein